MAARKPMMKSSPLPLDSERKIKESLLGGITDEQLKEQRISFIYGNAPENSGVTRESARKASISVRLMPV